MCYVQALILQVAQLVVIGSWRSLALLAYISEHSYEVWPGNGVTPPLIRYCAITTLLDRLGRLQRVFSALVLDRIVGKERVAAALNLASLFHRPAASCSWRGSVHQSRY